MSSIFGAPSAGQEGVFGIGAYEEADDEEVYSSDNMDILFEFVYNLLVERHVSRRSYFYFLFLFFFSFSQ